MESRAKKCRVAINEDRNFPDYSTELVKKLLRALESLTSLGHTVDLTPLKFTDCNAAAHSGRHFSMADCSTDKSRNTFVLVDIFQRGLQILMDFVDVKKVPSTCSKQETYVLRKLLYYLEKDRQFPTEGLNRSGTELAIVLANHLFSQLAPSPHYTIHENCAGKEEDDGCLCGTTDCKLTGCYGDTSIGNAEVWHGHLDIIVNSDVGVVTVEDTSGQNSSEVSVDLSRNPQIIAETIVFSFLQKQRHPERDHFLSPCIGVQGPDMVLMLYDSEHDVLLESSRIPLLDNETGEISSVAVVVSWLVVNHKYLCTGLIQLMKEYTADFFVHASTKIQVYRENLTFRNVENSSMLEKKCKRPKNKRRSQFLREVHKKVTDAIDICNEQEARKCRH